MPLGLSFAGTFQMRSRSLCSSANTVVAATISVTALTIVAMVPVFGSLALTGPTGDATGALRAGEPYYRDAGAEHDVRNANAFDFAFIEIELKTG